MTDHLDLGTLRHGNIPAQTGNRAAQFLFLGVYNHPGLASVCGSRELRLREHLMTCLYWFDGKHPLQADLLNRRDEVLPVQKSREAYLAHFRMWGQNMVQARIEGLAVRKGIREFIRPDATIIPPSYFYPSIGLDFVAQTICRGFVPPGKNTRNNLTLEFMAVYTIKRPSARGK